MYLTLASTGKAIREHGIKLERKNLLDFDYADDLSILEESLSKVNELLEVSPVQGPRIGLKINHCQPPIFVSLAITFLLFFNFSYFPLIMHSKATLPI